MNFFDQQDKARRQTGRLILLFGLAIVLIIGFTYVVTRFALSFFGYAAPVTQTWWEPSLFFAVAVSILAIVASGSGMKTLSLRRGGPAVAELAGGRLVQPQSAQPGERRLMNVVEEMAIASGVPVPSVYVLDEAGINAFAAGYGLEDAVIAVTQGGIDMLTRDELQGVVAHEFSHILNRDMRLNTRLTGLIYGILVLGLTGRLLLRTLGHGRVTRSNKNGGSTLLVIIAVGLTLFLLGYLGVFFGRMIRLAVSRQREFLADASAVQFTRNPLGLAGALMKIGGHAEGSRLQTPAAEELSHFFFSNALSNRPLSRWWSSHPPLEERIKRLDPSFDGTLPPALRPTFTSDYEGRSGLAPLGSGRVDPESVVERVATPTPAHLAYDDLVRSNIPAPLRQALRTSYSTVAAVYGLMLSEEAQMRHRQLAVLEKALSPALFKEVVRLQPYIDQLLPEGRLPFLDLSMPALREMSDTQVGRFLSLLRQLAQTDGTLSLFEFALLKITQYRLQGAFPTGRKPHRLHDEKRLRLALSTLLAALAHTGHEHSATAQAAFEAGLIHFGGPDKSLPLLPAVSTSAAVEQALDTLVLATPTLKQRFVDACAHCVLYDEEVTPQEAELLRVVVVAFGCPLPPFLLSSTVLT